MNWDSSTIEQLRIEMLHAIVAGYAFFFGATIGSFLNVVVYRMPRGLNIVRPRSRCPVCATPIALRDNIPVFSWLLLRGRCRCCATRISPRYVLVELAVGLLFVGLLYVEVISGGANLPFRAQKDVYGLISIHWDSMGSLACIGLFHAYLLITLLAVTLIQVDGLPVPKRLRGWPLLLGLVLPLIWPDLRPVSPTELAASGYWQSAWFLQFLASIEMMLWGFAFGCAMGLACHRHRVPAASPFAARNLLARAVRSALNYFNANECTIDGIGLVAVYLGWQPALTISCFAVSALLIQAVLTRSGLLSFEMQPVGWCLVGVVLYIPGWKWLAAIPHLPGYQTGTLATLGWLAVICATSLCARRIRRHAAPECS